MQIMIFDSIPDQKWFKDDEGSFWFHGGWVATALGFSNTGQAVKQHTENDERQQIDIGTLNPAWFVSEPGVWGMILGSRTDNAKAFRQKLKHEILPIIRKQGAYIDQSRFSQSELNQFDQIIQERDNRIAQLQSSNSILEGTVQKLKKSSVTRRSVTENFESYLKSKQIRHGTTYNNIFNGLKNFLVFYGFHIYYSKKEINCRSADLTFSQYMDRLQNFTPHPLASTKIRMELKLSHDSQSSDSVYDDKLNSYFTGSLYDFLGLIFNHESVPELSNWWNGLPE